MSIISGIELRKLIESKAIIIRSLVHEAPFDVDNQITEDGIDLRLYPFALKYKKTVGTVVDLLDLESSKYFDEIKLTKEGYTLEPNSIIFSQALETIRLPKNCMGYVFTRSTFARYGISITSGAPKFALGITWNFPFQIQNNTNVKIKIYPYMMIGQLQVMKVTGHVVSYVGRYQNSFKPVPPSLAERDVIAIQEPGHKYFKRTEHILETELNKQNEEIKKEVQQQKHKPYTEKRKETGLNQTFFFSLIAGCVFGISGSIIANGNIDYWKGIAIVTFLAIGILCGAFALKSNRSEEGD